MRIGISGIHRSGLALKSICIPLETHQMIPVTVIVGLVLIVEFYAIGIYNRSVKLKNLVAEAWSGIDVQLNKRYDLITNLVETVKGHAVRAKETFENVARARCASQQAPRCRGSAISGSLDPSPSWKVGLVLDHRGGPALPRICDPWFF